MMTTTRGSARCTALCAGLCSFALGAVSMADPAPASAPSSLTQAVNTDLRLTDSAIERIVVDTRPGVAFRMNVRLDGVLHTLQLWPHSARAPGYRLIAQVEDGSFVEMEPGPVRTVRGTVLGHPNSWIAGATDEFGFDGTLMLEDGTRYWIESLADDFVEAGAGDHVVYRADSVIPSDAKCGNDEKPNGIDDDDGQDGEVNGAPATFGGAFYDVELACDADVDYFHDYGSVGFVENRINLVTNTINLQYETQTQISHVITTIIVRTAEPDPYTSSNSDTLLCQFITEWTNNQQGIAFDVAKLFTGRDMGGVVGQAANFGEICERQGCCDCSGGGSLHDGAFCYSQSDFFSTLQWTTDLMAHELGHLWDAFHCSCPSFTMNPLINGANQFSAARIADIIAHRNSRTCLDPPQPDTGACCFDDGSCQVLSPTACANGGGSYQGDDVACGAANCAQPCPADLDDDNNVGFNDLLSLLSNWGPCLGCPEDIDNDNNVGFNDLLTLLSSWGPCR